MDTRYYFFKLFVFLKKKKAHSSIIPHLLLDKPYGPTALFTWCWEWSAGRLSGETMLAADARDSINWNSWLLLILWPTRHLLTLLRKEHE